jgi:hypothetical protein
LFPLINDLDLLNLLFIFLLGIGDWGLGIGDWGLGPIPNPQSPKIKQHNIIFLKIIYKNFKKKFLFKITNYFIKLVFIIKIRI